MKTTNRFIDKFMQYSAFADKLLLILSIFACTFFIYKDFDIRMIFGFGAIGCIWAIYIFRLVLQKRKLRFSPIEIAFAFFMGVLLTLFIRPDARHDSSTISYVISLFICGLYILSSRADDWETKKSLSVLMIIATIFSFAILLFKVFPDLYWNVIYPLLSDITQNMADDYVKYGYGVPIGGNYYFTNCILNAAIGAVVGLGIGNKLKLSMLCVGFFIFTGSALICVRGDFIAIILTFIFVYMVGSKTKPLSKKLIILSAICLVALIILVFTANLGLLGRYTDTVEMITDDKKDNMDDLSSGRTELWLLAIDLFTENPIFGIGWGNFSNHISDEFREVHGAQVTNVHNFILQFLCETGIVGTVLLLLPVGYIYLHTLAQTLRLRKHKQIDSWIIQANITSLTIQTFFCAGGMLNTTIFQFVFWSCYAVAVILSSCALRAEGYGFDDPFTSLIKNRLAKCNR